MSLSKNVSTVKIPECFIVKAKTGFRRKGNVDVVILQEPFENRKGVSWSVEGSPGVCEGKDDVGHQRLVEVGQKL